MHATPIVAYDATTLLRPRNSGIPRGRLVRLSSLCYHALRFAGVTSLARRLENSGVVLCYHNVVARPEDDCVTTLGLHMPLATFERQMQWLARHYVAVSLDEFVSRRLRGESLRGVAAITFDDGYAGVFDHAWPLLQHLGIPATVFVVADAHGRDDGFWWDDPDVLRAFSPERHRHWLTAFRGDGTAILASVAPNRPAQRPPAWCRPATWQAVAAAARSGLQIGAHSVTHRSLPTLDDAELCREVVESRDVIRHSTGVAPVFFAYPYSLWDDRVRRAVHAAGYHAAFTLAADRRTVKRDPWAVPRVSVPARIPDPAFQAWTAGLSLRRRSEA